MRIFIQNLYLPHFITRPIKHVHDLPENILTWNWMQATSTLMLEKKHGSKSKKVKCVTDWPESLLRWLWAS